MIVRKYGGSSVATPERIRRIAEKLALHAKDGTRLAVVVSAMGKTTNGLIELAGGVTKNPEPRELDMLLSTGEQVTAALLAMALNDMGVPAISYNAFQLGMVTTASYGNARIVDLDVGKLSKELERRGVVVITGFQGVTEEGDLTTLGRGGSDTSAVAIAANDEIDLSPASCARFFRPSTSFQTMPKYRACGTPSRNVSWLTTMSTAEPEMKPEITGRDSSCDRKPSRSSPQARIIAPDINASVAASTMYSAEPGVASGLSTA